MTPTCAPRVGPGDEIIILIVTGNPGPATAMVAGETLRLAGIAVAVTADDVTVEVAVGVDVEVAVGVDVEVDVDVAVPVGPTVCPRH